MLLLLLLSLSLLWHSVSSFKQIPIFLSLSLCIPYALLHAATYRMKNDMDAYNRPAFASFACAVLIWSSALYFDEQVYVQWNADNMYYIQRTSLYIVYFSTTYYYEERQESGSKTFFSPRLFEANEGKNFVYKLWQKTELNIVGRLFDNLTACSLFPCFVLVSAFDFCALNLQRHCVQQHFVCVCVLCSKSLTHAIRLQLESLQDPTNTCTFLHFFLSNFRSKCHANLFFVWSLGKSQDHSSCSRMENQQRLCTPLCTIPTICFSFDFWNSNCNKSHSMLIILNVQCTFALVLWVSRKPHQTDKTHQKIKGKPMHTLFRLSTWANIRLSAHIFGNCI